MALAVARAETSIRRWGEMRGAVRRPRGEVNGKTAVSKKQKTAKNLFEAKRSVAKERSKSEKRGRQKDVVVLLNKRLNTDKDVGFRASSAGWPPRLEQIGNGGRACRNAQAH